MDKQTDKEKWINEVMNSTIGMQKAQPNAFLYGKITSRLQQREEKISRLFIPRWVAVVILLVLVNCFSVIKLIDRGQQNRQHTISDKHVLSDFDTETIYNY